MDADPTNPASDPTDAASDPTDAASRKNGPRTLEPTSLTGDLPADLIGAFEAYEKALAANDLVALDAAFAPGPSSLRGDAAGLLAGHEQITRFRRSRGGTAPRGIRQLHVRVIDADHALIMSTNAPAGGGVGMVTQLWTRIQGDWVIAAAQVAGPAPAIDPTIWRIAGTPLVKATSRGELDGETVAVKDLFSIEGFAVGAGVPAFLAQSPKAGTTAPALRALLDAGASVIGIAQTDEFAYSIAGANVHYGTPPNPAVPGAISGGSSSGPAAAVALGQTSIGLGTDTAGSIRVPASYQGLWGLRTTHGSVSREGLLPLAPSFDTVGWLTRSPQVLFKVARATFGGAANGAGSGGSGLSGPAPEGPLPLAPAASLDASDEFVVDPALVAFADPDVRADFTERTRSLGAGVVALGDIRDLFEAFRTVQAAEAWRVHGEWITAHPGSLGADIAARFEIASRISAVEEQSARNRLADARRSLDNILEGRTLLLPSASSVAPARDAVPASIDATRSATLSMTCVAGIGGYPALSVPVLQVRGAPVGLCLVGARMSDVSLVSLGMRVAVQLGH